ncbi:MAG: hypothetical protein JJ971_09735 [Balneolaceae bacterium]|nr:hypothetical protein [Balneolaceae bacterium]MBO6546473.1 hypothetical protein [Balneolaceae bacterium]MBO6648832.1 hypothetical protein [Balneolaceae bacterium]
MEKTVSLVLLVLISIPLFAQEQQYKLTLLRANPGDLLELIEVIKEDISEHESLGIDKPYLLRHSQGDQWDLMLVYPIENLSSYFSEEQMINRTASSSLEKSYGSSFFDLVSFQEEAIVEGPDKELFNEWFEEYSYFHIEIFTALAGKQAELLKQRKMENEFYSHINHKGNFIFTRVFGPSWDILTIGAYYNIQDFAGDGSTTFEEEDEAAKKAGFDGVNYIGSYLRSLLLHHHDTLANKVNVD